MNLDVCSIGFIKAKFKLPDRLSSHQARLDAFIDLYPTARRTNHFIYLALGHQNIRDNDHGRDLVRTIKTLKGKITRVDFSVDLAEQFDFDAYKLAMDEKYKNQTMTDKLGLPQIYSSLEGTTVYIGKRPSGRFFRVYDKAAEILAKKKVDIEMHLTRFEIECKRDQVKPYLALFMSGATQAIVDDMAARYHVPQVSTSPNKILPSESAQEKNSCWSFVHRYRRIIAEAYYTDLQAFIDIIGEN